MAINEITSIDIKTLPPFKRMIMTLGELPTSYLESMTYAELLMWFCNFLQEKVLPTINNNADALQDVITYLENLDLQDEVNNKLDEMAESGQLQEIIAEYLNANALWCFDNVADMKTATNLIDGSYAKTLGYYSKNDNGMSTYKIRNITNDDVVDNATIIEIGDPNNQLIAELIIDKSITPEQFGCYGDNTHDDTINLQKAINKAVELNIELKAEKTYKTTSTITISGMDGHLDLSLSTINYDGGSSAIIITNLVNSTIKFGYINALSGDCVEFKSTSSNDFNQYDNLYFTAFRSLNNCIKFTRTGGWSNEIRLHDGRLEAGSYGIYANAGNINSINNISTYNIGFEGITTGIKLEGQCWMWNFNNCRYAEAFTTLIETTGDCRNCMWIGSVTFPTNKVNFSDNTKNFIINAPIVDANNQVIAYNGCYYGSAFKPQVKNLDALNLNKAALDNVVDYVMPEETYTDYIIIGTSHNTALRTIKLNKSYADTQWGNNHWGISEFILFMNFSTAQNLTIYDANDNVVFNQGHNYTKAYLKFRFVSNMGWICEQMDRVPTT